MDHLALMACYAAGIVALIMACRSDRAGFVTHAFAGLAGLVFGANFVATGLKTDIYSPVRWSGEAQTGPVTALVLVIALALPFVLSWERKRE